MARTDIRRDAKAWVSRMIEKFGTTRNSKRTAFVLPDGRQINYPGTGEIYHSGMVREVGAPSLDTFLCETGAIKLHDWRGEIAVHGCAHRPTPKQREVLGRVFRPRPGERDRRSIAVDVSAPLRDYPGKLDYGWVDACHFEGRDANIPNVVKCLTKHKKRQ